MENSPEVSPYDLEMASRREAIDEIDQQLVELINRRAEVALEVGRIKLKYDKPIYVSSRENEVLDKVAEVNDGNIVPEKDVRSLFSSIMETSRAAQQRLHDTVNLEQGEIDVSGKRR